MQSVESLSGQENRESRRRIWERTCDRLFGVFIYVCIFLVVIAILYPLIYTLSASFSSPSAVSSGRMMLFPVEFTLDGYRYIIQYSEIWSGYANTIFYTVVGTLLNLLVTIPCAYALSERNMVGRNFLMMVFVFTMYFSGGMIPGYLNIVSLGLLNTRAVVLLNGLVSVYNLIVARTFFSTSVPWELHEAAMLDGASDFGILMRVVLPLSKPVIAVLSLYYAVGHWNSYFSEMIYLTDRSKYPLQVILREILTLSQFNARAMEDGGLSVAQMQEMIKATETANLVKYCVIVVSVVPMMVLYPFMQKFFAEGVMIGAVKG